MSHLLWLSRSICLLFVLFSWQVVLACKVAILAHVILLMVFSFLPHVFSKLVTMVFCIQVISSCFHRVHHFRVVFRVWVVSKLVGLACVAFRLFSQSVWPSSSTFLSCVTFTFIFCFPFSFIACMAYKVFSWPVLPSSCFHGVCRRQVSGFLALDAFRQFYITCIALSFSLFVACVAVAFVQPLSRKSSSG